MTTRLPALAEEAVDHYGVVMADPEGNEFCLHRDLTASVQGTPRFGGQTRRCRSHER
jgi:hypothetical protein